MRKNEVFDSQGNVVKSIDVPFTGKEINNALVAQRDYRAAHYPYKGILLRLSEAKAMNQLSTLFLLCLANPSIPDAQVMADWQEEEGDIQITAGDLRADGMGILGNYQKAWSVFRTLKTQSFNTPDSAITAFNNAMDN